ncbi:MAG TPA: DUF5335 family protein [Burkholderiales bacterium]|nr:DUF5335 family protein [Burkholderiales bacterium]
MSTREISRADWPAFMDCFSRQHLGWLSTIEVLDSTLGAQTQVREQPFAGITAETHGGHSSIAILMGKGPDLHVGHLIRDAAHVRLKESDGAHEALQIEAGDGVTTLLTFRSVMPTELVDGVVMQ